MIVFGVVADAVSGSAAADALCIEWFASSWIGLIVRAGNKIGAAGCEWLFGTLRVNSTLTSLSVDGECECDCGCCWRNARW